MKTGWKPIEKEPKSLRKGVMRIYTFSPKVKNHDRDFSLQRDYRTERYAGSRTCDAYIEIPVYEEK